MRILCGECKLFQDTHNKSFPEENIKPTYTKQTNSRTNNYGFQSQQNRRRKSE